MFPFTSLQIRAVSEARDPMSEEAPKPETAADPEGEGGENEDVEAEAQVDFKPLIEVG